VAAKLAEIAEKKAKIAQQLEEHRKKQQAAMPPPLILDAQGREVDAAGKVLAPTSAVNLKTLKANKKFDLLENAAAPDVTKTKYYDPRVPVSKVGRAKREWSFVEHGTYPDFFCPRNFS